MSNILVRMNDVFAVCGDDEEHYWFKDRQTLKLELSCICIPKPCCCLFPNIWQHSGNALT